MGFSPHSYGSEVLVKFGLSQDDLLGQGAHSRVFKTDRSNVIRIHSPETNFDYIQSVANFFDSVDSRNVDFAIPRVTEIGQVGDTYFTIEAQFGNNMEQAFHYFEAERRNAAYKEYVDCIKKIKQITLKNTPDFYGEIIGSNPLRCKTWNDYLTSKASQSLEVSRRYLANDMRNFEIVFEVWTQAVIALPEPGKHLVHGDYHPGNLLVDENAKVEAVIDFSEYSLIGDPKYDAVYAAFHSVLNGFNEQEAATLEPRIRKLCDLDDQTFYVYQIFACLLLTHRIHQDYERLYKGWCLKYLKLAGEKLLQL